MKSFRMEFLRQNPDNGPLRVLRFEIEKD
jgi:hypothetical protein